MPRQPNGGLTRRQGSPGRSPDAGYHSSVRQSHEQPFRVVVEAVLSELNGEFDAMCASSRSSEHPGLPPASWTNGYAA